MSRQAGSWPRTQAGNHKLCRDDTVIVFGHRLEWELGHRRAVLAAARLFNLHRRRLILANDELILCRADVVEVIGVGRMHRKTERLGRRQMRDRNSWTRDDPTESAGA